MPKFHYKSIVFRRSITYQKAWRHFNLGTQFYRFIMILLSVISAICRVNYSCLQEFLTPDRNLIVQDTFLIGRHFLVHCIAEGAT